MSRTVPIALFTLAAATLIAATPATADEPKSPFSSRGNSEVFALAVGKADTPFDDNATKPAGWNDDLFRPNATRVYHLYVFNPTNQKDTFKVELDAGFKAQATIDNLEPGKWTRVKFPAVSPPPAAVVPPPAPVPPGTTLPPAADPPPAGRELARTPNGFPFAFRLLNKNGEPVIDDQSTGADKGKPYGRAYTAAVAEPGKYLKFSDFELKRLDDKTAQASVSVTPQKADDTTPADLKLSFPKRGSPTGPVGPATRDGVYHRTLFREPGATAAPSVQLRGTAAGFGPALRADVAADGVERAVIFEGVPTAEGVKPIPLPTVAIRVYPAAALTLAVATKPAAAFPVRVEVDNAPPGATVELRYRTAGDTVNEEVVPLGGPRNDQMWLDVTDAGIGVSTKSKEWEKALNLADARGKIEVVAAITERLKDGQIVRKSEPLVVTVDVTPPEPGAITLLNLKNDRQLEKGQPLKLSATAADLDSGVKKAVFFLGVPTDDGKLPPDAVQVPGDRVVAKGKESWTAALPLAADKRGYLTVGVIFTDDAGNAAPPAVKRIEVVDAGAGGAGGGKPGKIEGRVLFGETPQPGVKVSLAGDDGKPKDEAKTDDKGKFTFKDVPPGSYKVSAAKTDPTTGLTGSADVAVKPGETAKPSVELKKVRK